MRLPGQILLATGNAHKIAEIRVIIAALLPNPVELLSLSQAGISAIPDDVERYSTFTANARAKAEWCRDRSGLPCLADDSGICVDALNGRPGIHSARWGGPGSSSAELNDLLLRELENAAAISPKQRSAHYNCSAAIAYVASKDERVATLSAFGAMHGRILPKANSMDGAGFGYDPIFFSDDLGMCVAAAAGAEKNRCSHRARALRALLGAIR